MTSDDPLDVYVVTVREYYYVPAFLTDIFESDQVRIRGIAATPATLGGEHIITFAAKLFRHFGPLIFGKQVRFYFTFLLLDIYARITGRGEAYSPKTLASRHDVPYMAKDDIGEPAFLETVREIDPDVVVSVAATQRFETELLDIPSHGCINVHSSLLPAYRGVSPSFWSLYHDEDRTGITVHYMDEELDSGDIILQRPVPIEPDDTVHTLNERVATEGAAVLSEALAHIRNGTVNPIPMETEKGSYYSLPERDDVQDFRERGNRFY
ncbi:MULTISPECIES: methionyl-tRNA formyltransferase [Haloarcula]|uniref:methionyl-tRNA formyltransferase n=1 Tax=Haloarcula TaxID=2237 RepID=UPI0023ED28F2|nr:formyltransferase family protein [Halomicroarcula sp. XH51]